MKAASSALWVNALAFACIATAGWALNPAPETKHPCSLLVAFSAVATFANGMAAVWFSQED